MVGRGLDPALVRAGNQAATGGLRPDLTLILDLAPELGQARQIAAGKRQDRLDRESAEFHRRVVEYYLAVEGDGVRHLDGTPPAGPALAGRLDRGPRCRPGNLPSGGGVSVYRAVI